MAAPSTLAAFGSLEVTAPDAMDPDVAARRLLVRALVDQRAVEHVGDGDVVLREGGPFPDVARLRRVDDDLTAEEARIRRGTGSTWLASTGGAG